MLCISRKVGTEIVIDEKIVVKVLEVTGQYVRLGLTAPKDVKILRAELLEREGAA